MASFEKNDRDLEKQASSTPDKYSSSYRYINREQLVQLFHSCELSTIYEGMYRESHVTHVDFIYLFILIFLTIFAHLKNQYHE